MVQLNDAGVPLVGTGEQEPLTSVRRAVWGTLYADDAGIVSKSAEGLTKMMSHRDCLRRSRSHNSIGKEDRDNGSISACVKKIIIKNYTRYITYL